MCGSEFDRDSNAKSFINPYLTIFKMSDEKQIYHLSGQTSVSQLQDIMTIGVDGYDVTECYICGKQVYVQGRDAPQEWIDKVITHILRKSSKDLNLGKHFTDEQQQELWMLAKQIIEKNIISHTINY
jgi:hypothetical protein